MEELIPIFLFISVAAVLILRPLTRRLGMLLEAVARSRMGAPPDTAELARVRGMLEHVSKRLDLAEERLDFTERLVGSAQRQGMAGPRTDEFRLDPLAASRREPPAERGAGYVSR